MALDTDPGVGTGTTIAGGIPAALPDTIPTACISFDRSLELLMIGPKGGAYGYKSPDYCDAFWQTFQREGWITHLQASHSELKRDLGAPLCPQAHYDELHDIKQRIRLRQAPVAYLGRHTFTEWTEVNLSMDWANAEATMELCDQDLSPGTITDVQVSYPDSILDVYQGVQALQAPIVSRITSVCNGIDDGYLLTWPLYQLVKPFVNETENTVAQRPDFVQVVKWRLGQVDSTLAYELVGECNCDLPDATYTLTLEDATEGIVCVECDSSNLCTCGGQQMRINYATAFSTAATMDPALAKMIILLALVHSAETPVKPRGCDKKFVKEMLELDPTAGTDFASRLRYGPTKAGMQVMRTMDRFMKRPHFNQEVMSGGLLTSRRKKRRRRSSVLRG